MTKISKLGIVPVRCKPSRKIALILLLAVAVSPLNASLAEEAVIHQDQILALNERMKSMVDLFVRPVKDKTRRAQALLDLMFNKNKMAIEYDFLSTKTAIETIESGSGNCLSLANAYIAMGRYAGLDVRYLAVDMPNNWLEIDEYFYLTKHTTASVKISPIKIATIEFTGMLYREYKQSEFIADHRGFAQYYSNVGVEFFRQNKLHAAMLNLEKAVKTDVKYDHAWNNLGIVYRRLGRYQDAEQAYKKALAISRKNLSALSNLAALYALMGNTKFTEKYRTKLERYKRQNPYYLAKLAEQKLAERDYASAARLAKQAIKKQKDEHRFYFILAKAYARMGKRKQLKKSLEQALSHADSAMSESRYRHKLDLLEKRASTDTI